MDRFISEATCNTLNLTCERPRKGCYCVLVASSMFKRQFVI